MRYNKHPSTTTTAASSKTSSTAQQQLPTRDAQWLTALGVRIRYIPPSPHESFYETGLHKFRVLTLTEYRRVMLLDADVLPLTNLDYLFALSDNDNDDHEHSGSTTASAVRLKENVIVAGRWEPAHGALFVLSPTGDDDNNEYQRILDLVRHREETAAALSSPWQSHKFDEHTGWGHTMDAAIGDKWRARNGDSGTEWDFRCAFADQGLLYHYTKYVRQNVSILFGSDQVENWGSSFSSSAPTTTIPQLEGTLQNPFANVRKLPFHSKFLCKHFLCDVAHFGGASKPWMNDPPEPAADLAQPVVDLERSGFPTRIWWHTLYELNRELQMGLGDFANWTVLPVPPHGLFPTYSEMDQRVERRRAGAEDSSPAITAKMTKAATAELRRDYNSNESPSTTQQTITSSNYAIAYVIGGCDPENGRYRGFLYNILISTRVLREEGSTADVVAFFQMSYKSGATALPDGEAQWLQAMGVKVEYIPPSPSESFYDTVLNKFRILQLTKYKRVLLLDGDVMPVANADVLFQLSDGMNAPLKENIVVMGPLEPANGGLFMLAPEEGEWERVQEIIRKREKDATGISDGRKFDEIKGWGHQIQPPDRWESRYDIPWLDGGKEPETVGLKWDFHFAFSDQGLLYHYTKYVRKSVSMLTGYGGRRAQNWGAAANGTVVLEEIIDLPFEKLSKPRIEMKIQCKKFLCEFAHFTANNKPWLTKPTSDMLMEENKNVDARYIWWNTLRQLNGELQMGLDFENWDAKGYPPYGMYARFEDLDRRVNERASLHAST